MKPLYKRTFIRLALYGILLLLGALLHMLSPGGPCVPGGGALFYGFVFPIAALCFFVWDLLRVMKGNKQYYLSLVMDVMILLLLIF